MTRFSLVGAALALLGLASPAAALTLEIDFAVVFAQAMSGPPAPVESGDPVRIVATLQDRVADPVDFDGLPLHPVSSFEVFADGASAFVATPATSTFLGWSLREDVDVGSGPEDRLSLVFLERTGDLGPIVDGILTPPTGAGQSGALRFFAVNAYGASDLFDGDGPEQFLKLDAMDVEMQWQDFDLVSAYDSVDEAWVWETGESAWIAFGNYVASSETSAVPLPAAGLLLPAALGATVLVARRRRAARA